MLFNTHDRTPRVKTNKTLKIMFIFLFVIVYGFFVFAAIATSVVVKSIQPALIILIPIFIITLFVLITTCDMQKAYVKIDENKITVVDFWFLKKKERNFTTNEIRCAEIINGYSLRVRGYRYPRFGYIVFRGNDNKYLFKIICLPETKAFFEKMYK